MNILTSLQKLAGGWKPKGFTRLATGIVSALAVCSATSVLGQTNVANVSTLGGGPGSQDVATTAGSSIITFTDSPGGTLVPGIKLDTPLGMAVDSLGNLYVAESAQGNVLKVTNPGNRSTSFTFFFAGGLTKPVAIAVNQLNNDVYVVTETDGLIWRYNSEGTLVGGAAINAGTPLVLPSAITIDSAGNLFVTEQGGAVKRVTPAGVVTTIVAAATFSAPSGIAAYQTNVVAISDTGNNAIKLLNVVNFSITTLAGGTGAGFTNGPGASAKFDMPRQLALAPNGSLLIADQNNHRVRILTAEGTVETLYGVSTNKWPENPFFTLGYPGWQDGTNAHANQPWGVAVSPSGTNIFVTEIGHDLDLLRGVGNLSFAAATGGGAAGGGVGNVSLTGNIMTFGFASGEGSASFLAKAGQTYFVPVTLTLPPAQNIYSLGFSLAATNRASTGAPAIPGGVISFDSMLMKPIPGISGGQVLTVIPPGAWIGVYTNRITIDTTTGAATTNLVPIVTNTVYINAVQNVAAVSWLEVPGETNLYNTVSQDLISFSQAHINQFSAHSSGKAIVGSFGFFIPAGAPVGSQYRVQVFNASGSSNLNGGVSIVTPVGGSLSNGPINSIKEITVVGSIRYLVGDLEEFRWINAGEFGDGKIDIIDAQETFMSAIYRYNMPTPGSDFFGAMDSYNAASAVDPSTGNIDTVLTGDGAITIGDVQVTLRRALDPFVGWVTREAGGTAPLLIPTGLTQPTFGLSSFGLASATAPMNLSEMSSLKLVAGQVQAAGPGQIAVPIKAIISGSTPIKSLMFALEVEAIGGSPVLQTGLQFQQTATTLGAPRFTTARGNTFGAAWMNTLNSSTPFGVPGLGAGEHLIGNLLIDIPAGVTDYSAYVVRVKHVSAIGTKRESSANGLVVFSDRTGSTIGDAIPDSWRLRYFNGDLNLLAAATADADGDGIPNWAEYRAGTDPNDADSALRVGADTTTQTAAGITIRWPSEPGLSYVVEYSTTLASGNWTQMGAIVTGTGGELSVTDPASSTNGRFYRVRLVESAQ
jgi:DNA-binding beta-propeller fold protein YncE